MMILHNIAWIVMCWPRQWNLEQLVHHGGRHDIRATAPRREDLPFCQLDAALVVSKSSEMICGTTASSQVGQPHPRRLSDA